MYNTPSVPKKPKGEDIEMFEEDKVATEEAKFKEMFDNFSLDSYGLIGL